jgi:choline transport protein
MAISIATAIPFIIVLVCGIRDMDAVQNAFLPILEIFFQMTGSRAVATLLQACLAGLYFCTSCPFPWGWGGVGIWAWAWAWALVWDGV